MCGAGAFQEPLEHLSGERLQLAGGEGGARRPICICFYSISTPCTLTLSGKSLLNSLLGAAGGGGAGKRPGWKGRFQADRVCLSPRRGLGLPSAACLPRTRGLGRQTLSPRAPGGRRRLWPARPGARRAGCARPAPASPGEVLVRRWVPASCLYSPQRRGEIPRPSFAAQRPCWLFKCAQAEFRSKPQFNVNQK